MQRNLFRYIANPFSCIIDLDSVAFETKPIVIQQSITGRWIQVYTLEHVVA
jgi:hypothetical protein